MPPTSEQALTYDGVILGRRSIRGYKRDPAPKAVIPEVIAMAMRSPSSLNTQPWNFHVVGGDIGPFDCGAVSNALVNAAWSRGLGCAINSQGIMQSPVVREHAGIPEDQVIMICIAMGYPDDAFPANAAVSERKSVDDAVVFVGLED